jgi:hypothetical protein
MTIPYDWARVECPTCKQPPDTKCQTLTSGRSTDAHDRRIQMGSRMAYARKDYAENGCRCSQAWTGIAPAYGLSAYAIKHGTVDHPLDPSDLCRCLHVSPSAPLHMRNRSPQWAALVEHWDELAALLREEHPNGTAPKTYARMKELSAAARAA